jgi:hypothetical protein
MTEHLQSLAQSNAFVQDGATATASSSMHNSRHTVQLQRQASLQVVNGKLIQVNKQFLHIYAIARVTHRLQRGLIDVSTDGYETVAHLICDIISRSSTCTMLHIIIYDTYHILAHSKLISTRLMPVTIMIVLLQL